jgi:hypothetical protein
MLQIDHHKGATGMPAAACAITACHHATQQSHAGKVQQ